jgi:hypothetical protein
MKNYIFMLATAGVFALGLGASIRPAHATTHCDDCDAAASHCESSPGSHVQCEKVVRNCYAHCI